MAEGFKRGEKVKIEISSQGVVSDIIRADGGVFYEIEWPDSEGQINFVTFSEEHLKKA